MPNLWELPTAISAPNSAGVFNFAKANKSQTSTALPLCLWILLIASLGSLMSPNVPGYWIIPQITSSLISLSSSPTIISNPKGSALVLTTSLVCGGQFFETKRFFVLDLVIL